MAHPFAASVLFIAFVGIPLLYFVQKWRFQKKYGKKKENLRQVYSLPHLTQMDPILLMSATELAQKIRKKELSSFEVVKKHIEWMEKVNPTINAVVAERFQEALKEAKEADEKLKIMDETEIPPFFGVPFTVKECFSLKGQPNSSGLYSRRFVYSETNATVVERLMSAGAIPLGVTNVSELCMWMESNNNVYGRTLNPYDPARIVGGSSGGEAAIVASGASPFGVGSDIGGSIRMPSFFCGVFGHKPTGGLVPATGQHPIAHGKALKMLSTGPIARRAEDLFPLLLIMAGPDGRDQGCEYFEMKKEPKDVDLKNLIVVSFETNQSLISSQVDAELLAMQRKCVSYLEQMGAQVQHREIPKHLQYSLEIWAAMLDDAGGPSFASMLGGGQPVFASLELLKWFVGKSKFTLPAIGLALLEKVPKYFPGRTRYFLQLREELHEEILGILQQSSMKHTVILYPPYVSPAPTHNKPLLPPVHWVYTAIWNALHLPSTQVPLGLSSEKVPLGVQVIGNHGEDHVTIAVAMALEQQFGGWIFPKHD